MQAKYSDFGFYVVDINYLKYLHDIDSEVFYDAAKAYDRKPFLGVIVTIDNCTYFIPLTSGKPKHADWKLCDTGHYLIYEIIKNKAVRKRDIIKQYKDEQVYRILAVLDIKKMIPVPQGRYMRIDFSQVEDKQYRRLLIKEYEFCWGIRDGVLERAVKIYTEQKQNGKVYPFYCDYSRLEKACAEYENNTAVLV